MIKQDLDSLIQKQIDHQKGKVKEHNERRDKVAEQVNELYKDLTPFQIRDIVIQSCEIAVADQMQAYASIIDHWKREYGPIRGFEMKSDYFHKEHEYEWCYIGLTTGNWHKEDGNSINVSEEETNLVRDVKEYYEDPRMGQEWC